VFMHNLSRTLVAACLIGLALAPLTSPAKSREECERAFMPQTGQAGKDVVWVPTNDRLVTKMLQMAQVRPTDQVYDLGAGDGKIAIAAAKEFGARAVGVEYNQDMAQLAQCYAEVERVTDRVRIVQGDIFETDFSTATVVTLYLLPELNLRLRPTILKMKPGTRVVSHSFMMDDWEPDERSTGEDGQAYLWIVPARVDGTWTFRRKDGNERFVVQLEQKFQEVTGGDGNRAQQVTDARLRGSQLELSLSGSAPMRLVGQVDGDRMDAKVTRGDTTTAYIGTRSSAGGR
jgi:SAM-dependent methyltransferase